MALARALADGRSVQSTTPTPRAAAGDVNLSGSSSDPTSVMSSTRKSERLKTFRIPSFSIPYTTVISIADYQRTSWAQLGDLSPTAKIALPLPTKIVDSQRVLWNDESLGAFGPMVGGDAVRKLAGGDLSGIAGSGLGAGVGLVKTVGGQIADGGIGAISASIGVAVNNFLTLMLKGPTYKVHTFTWKISPTSERDSNALSDLYRLISSAGSVSLSSYTGSAFFNYPKIFQLSFEHSADASFGYERLFQFKKSVLTRADWDFTPMNVPAFYGKTRAPESVQFTLEFTELEFWLADDYSTEGGYGDQYSMNPTIGAGIDAAGDVAGQVGDYLKNALGRVVGRN